MLGTSTNDDSSTSTTTIEENNGSEFDGETKENSIGKGGPAIINNPGKYPSEQNSVLTF